MEERKKITVSIEEEKFGVLIVGDKKGSGNVTAKVKNGSFLEVDQEKFLGTWVDKTASYMVNIVKRKEKIQYMTSHTKNNASTRQMGTLAIQARLKMIEIILVKSFLYNVEAFSTHTNKEVEELERIQANFLRDLLEVPSSTPYLPLLLETGMWTMEARIAYRKLMLFHHIINSSDDRIITNIIRYQMDNFRRGTWYHSIHVLLEKYNLKWTPEQKKSKWKKDVKQNISRVTEEEIRMGCNTTKGRTIAKDKYETKRYLLELPVEEAKYVLRMRTHMVDIPCNYGERDRCWLCGKEETIRTEHYLVGPETKVIRKCVGINNESFDTLEKLEQVKLSKFFQLLEQRNVLNEKLNRKK